MWMSSLTLLKHESRVKMSLGQAKYFMPPPSVLFLVDVIRAAGVSVCEHPHPDHKCLMSASPGVCRELRIVFSRPSIFVNSTRKSHETVAGEFI